MFRTEVIPRHSKEKITLSSPILSIGSCFSDCMGERLINYKFDAITNPYGTVYNPISIFKLLDYTQKKIYPDATTYLETQGMQANYDFHSSFSTVRAEDIRAHIHSVMDRTSGHLNKTAWMIITFGTAFVYRRKDNNEIVANCHKVPANQFSKELLTQKQLTDAFKEYYEALQVHHPGIEIILTVSPVRHIKDMIEQNNVSKSILRIACDTLEKEYPAIQYFPSYEIMMDDLRDYRFYKSDMIHPTKDAEDYIWNKFAEAYFDQDTQHFMDDWSKVLKAIRHRPFNPASEGHQKFIKETIAQLRRLEEKVDVNKEITLLKDQLYN